jgi:predicted nuclease of predicted toxin-antitoxin system
VKVLLDACVWGGARVALAAAGVDVVWAGDWQEDPGDEAILARALAERRVLITLDRDFGELAVVRRHPHCGIVRVVRFGAREQARACLDALGRFGDELSAGAIVTVEPGRVRIRPADAADDES